MSKIEMVNNTIEVSNIEELNSIEEVNDTEKMNDTILRVQGLKKKYVTERSFFGHEKSSVNAVDDISFFINRGESFGLVGESGCGKSTTARAVLKLIESDGGKVVFEGKTLFDCENKKEISSREMSVLRKDMQIIFQDPFASLDNRMKIGRIIAEGIEKHKLAKGREALEMARHYLEICGVDKDAMNRYPHEFSGGQRQRIVIARALAVQPKFIVADEPVAALDVSIQAQIINLLNELKEKYALTFLFISHDLGIVKYFCDRIAVMYLGKIVEIAERDELFENPLHPYTKKLLESIPVNHPRLRKTIVNLDEGEAAALSDDREGCSFYNRCRYSSEKCLKEKSQLKEIKKGHFAACHNIL